ncbi:type II secretion system protein [Cerasicoccus arenae]|uniref:Prepilin-type N-terminal cleavage/methylation domain-containing protein n=1 Tax=Cerasicoccus arenae TaxID=424488 RepID=A0A8J3DB78_9BACT|nr:prepilin-type N-terminal cleavage/methylation domain-containing protein [Cerasicoccus arenae]MBK1857225.1 prepilin-type N-terminal cleavage/methylation domain-containing protein [Cerasicoccus arenae]GHC00114.1 hypothetical protein GCM10007047_15450 [Cerasicoccus arenae]
MKKQLTPLHRHPGFTLVELLTVIAIIGILAGILIPVVGGAKKSALKAQSRAQFNGWATALEAYKAEYGYYPELGSLNSDGGPITVDSYTDEFIKALSGRDKDGARLTGNDRSTYNRKNIGFYSFGEAEFKVDDPDLLVDAFDNPEIYIMVDHDGDGMIDSGSFPEQAKPTNGGDLRAKVAIWVQEDGVEDGETIWSWQ